MGVYQRRQAKGYSKEHQTDAWKYQIFVNKEQYGVLKSQIHSGNTSNRTYNLWIEHSTSLNPIMQNRALGRLVVVLILHLSHGILALNGIKPQHKHLRHMINIWILSQMLQLKCGNPISNSSDESDLKIGDIYC